MLLVGNGPVITRDENNPFFANGCVVIEGDVIKEVGDTEVMKRKYSGASFVDAEGNLVMPGFINAHMHFYSTFSRGMPSKYPPAQNFTEVLERLWWRLDKALTLEGVYYSTLTALVDCIKNGCTTIIDHHASPLHVAGSLFEIGKATRLAGLRASLCYEVSDRDGKEVMRQGIKENIDFIDHANNAARNGDDRIAGMFGLHASVTLSGETLAQCREAIGDRNVGYHVHVAEGPADEEDSLAKYGKRIVQRFHEFGITGDKSLFIHCVHLDNEELETIKRTGTAVVHNPESNMGNAVGCTPLLKICDMGILTGLGTDGYVSDMLQSYKMANALQKHHNRHPNVAWGEIPTMLFENNAKICARYFKTPVGKLASGCAGDVVVSDYIPPTPLSAENINGHLLFGTTGRSVLTTVASGKVLMRDRHLAELDEKAIFAKAREVALKTWEAV
ncbi:MAG: putative aminohydrolase SsnA [Synergistaceae bacterium]|jgi:putative selenium metabolism protein SsnA|nr:putative aminohydrolase SsnA [Synergistaceae bacterium]